MELIRSILDKQKQLAGKRWFPFARFVYTLLLSMAAVLPLMHYVVLNIPFAYEMNDDALIAQFLDGSYTGTPEAHAFYIRYPLSRLIAELYKRNPALPDWLWPSGVPGIGTKAFEAVGSTHIYPGTNWFVFTIAALAVFAMVCVLFRILQAFRGNRLILCVLFDLAIGFLWLPHFSFMTFTTAAAFMGVMGVLFFGFLDPKEAARPWNLLILVILLGSSWCIRRQCFMMVMPFIAVMLILKFRTMYFRSWRPWLTLIVIIAMTFGLVNAEKKAYDSKEWQAYRTYNAERSWMQDYGRIPPYEGNEKFYDEIDIGPEGVTSFTGYTYCLMEDFGPEKVHKIYEYATAQYPDEKISFDRDKPFFEAVKSLYKTLRPIVEEMIPAAQEAYDNPEDISAWTVLINPVLWECLIPLLLLSLVTVRKKRWSESFALLLEIVSMGTLVAGEWIYLMMNGRFPRRVEETIWLLTFSIGVLLAGHILTRWRDIKWCKLPGLIQIIMLVVFMQHNPLPAELTELQGQQIDIITSHTRKAEVLEYCGEHPDNRYILRTSGFSGSSTPYDELHQGNWYMSGSWAAYSPFYYQKMAADDTDNLGLDFLKRDNVYVVTKGKANIRRMTGRSVSEPVYSYIADSFTTSDGTEYLVYKVY